MYWWKCFILKGHVSFWYILLRDRFDFKNVSPYDVKFGFVLDFIVCSGADKRHVIYIKSWCTSFWFCHFLVTREIGSCRTVKHDGKVCRKRVIWIYMCAIWNSNPLLCIYLAGCDDVTTGLLVPSGSCSVVYYFINWCSVNLEECIESLYFLYWPRPFSGHRNPYINRASWVGQSVMYKPVVRWKLHGAINS